MPTIKDNNGGSVPVSTRFSAVNEDMEAYDRLPKIIRDKLKNTPYQFSAQTIEDRLKSRGYSWVMDKLQSDEIDNIMVAGVLETYGPSHPQAKEGRPE